MFENIKRSLKVKDFRRDGVTVLKYDCIKHTITLKSKHKRKVELAFKLVDFDYKLQLAFSGDCITSDGEALARVMRTMWNYELPADFSENEDLRMQIFGPQMEASEIIKPTKQAEAEAKDEEKVENVQNLIPLHFRDMANYVAGMPNEVIVTIKASYRIDNT